MRQRLVDKAMGTDDARIEMTPLLDIIFLLLTFFIYSLVLTVQARVLPMKFPTLAASQQVTESRITGITVGKDSTIYLNQKATTFEALRERLTVLAQQPDPPAVFVALDAEAGGVDRGPLLIKLIDTVRQLGIKDLYIVGAPDSGKAEK